MAKSVNKVILLGNVGNDPEVSDARNGIVVNFSLATDEGYPDGRGGWRERTEWHFLKAFQRNAEIIRDYVRKGSTLYIEGKLLTESWDDRKTGERKYRTKIVVLDVGLLSHRVKKSTQVEANSEYDEDLALEYAYIPDQEISLQEIPY